MEKIGKDPTDFWADTLVEVVPIYKGYRVIEEDERFSRRRETLIENENGTYRVLSSIFV